MFLYLLLRDFLFRFVLIIIVLSGNDCLSQDTIILGVDTIRVGGLEWDLEKELISQRTVITSNPNAYGENIKILHGFYKNRMVEQIVFGYELDGEFIPHGPARYYYGSGEMLGKRTFILGKLEGPGTDYHKNGMVKVAAFFKNDFPDSVYKTYFETGGLEGEYFFKNGLPEGTQRIYFNTGQIKHILFFANGLQEENDTLFFETGQIWKISRLSGGEKNGDEVCYHRNGVIETIWVYEYGKLIDIRFIHNTEGRPLEVGDFEDGKGRVNFYNDRGFIKSWQKFKNGGPVKSFQVKEKKN